MYLDEIRSFTALGVCPVGLIGHLVGCSVSTEFGKVRRLGAHRAPYKDLPRQPLTEEPEPPSRAELDAAMLAVDGQAEPGPFQSAESQDGQAWRMGTARRVQDDPLNQTQAERRGIPQFIASPRLISMHPDIGVTARSGDVVDADIVEPLEKPPGEVHGAWRATQYNIAVRCVPHASG